MILRQLKTIVVQKRVVSLQELSKTVARSPELVSDMLEHWLRKGVIRKLEPRNDCNLPCNSCRGCSNLNQVFYQALQAA